MWAEWGTAKFVRDVGVPGVIALLLVWVVSTQVMQAIEQHDADSAALTRQLIAISEQNQRTLTRLCLNTAPSPAAREGCFPQQ